MSAPVVPVAVRRLRPGDTTPLPRYQSDGAAGMDLHAALDSTIVLAPGERRLVPSGLAIAVPPGWEGQIRPRSGLALRHGLTIPNAPGTVDSDYRGEVQVLLLNCGTDAVTIEPGDRIAQLVLAPVGRVAWTEVPELPATSRGTGGFGSTDERERP